MSIPQLDLFSSPEYQDEVERDVVTDHRPLSVLSSKNHIDFEIQLPEDEYLQFSETYLYLKMKVNLTKEDGQAADDEDWKTVVPSQYLLNTMFKQVNLKISNVEVVQSTGNFMYKAYIEALLGYSYDARTGHLTAAMWSQKDDETLTNYLKKGEEFETMGRLHLDLTHQEKALVGNTRVALRLYTNSVDFMFKRDPKLNLDYEILDAYLDVHRIGVSDSVVKKHRLKLNNSLANYNFTRSEVRNLCLVKGSQDVSLDNVFSGVLPRRIFFCMVDNDAYNGDPEKDPFDFVHFGLCFFACYVDGRQYPPNGLTPNFKKGNYVREYLSLVRALNQNGTESICNLDIQDYKDNRIIIGVNFAPDLSNGLNIEGKRNPSKTGSLRIKLKFEEPLKQQVTAIVYAEFDSDIKIDGFGNAVTNYM